jgi:hypothetical protein
VARKQARMKPTGVITPIHNGTCDRDIGMRTIVPM